MKRPKEGGRRRMRGGEGGGGGSSPVQQQSRVVVVVLVLVVSSLLLSSSSSLASASVLAEDLPRITRHPESAIIAHHLPVTLHCQAHPPSATLRWLFNGAPLRPSSHPGLQLRGSDLHFGHFRHGSANGSHGNDGEYRCTASTSAGTVVSRPAVLSKPVLHAFPRSDDIVMEVYEGGFTTIPCSAPFSLPPATVRVLTSRGDLLDDSHEDVQRLPSGSVVLKRVGADRADNYTCVAFNPVSGHNRSASHRVRLSVLPSPPGVSDVQTEIVDRSTPTLEVREGRSVVLECPVTGVGVPSVTWTRGYGTLPHGHSLGPFGNLHISSVKLRDVGTYICQTPGGHKRQVFLDVHRAPSVTPHPPGGVLRAREGEGVRLVCKGGALPAPAVTWFHDGQRVPPGASVSSVGEVHTLHLEEVAEEDGGLYVCELTNSVGQDSAVLQLVVTSPHSDRQWHAQKDNPSDASREENSEGEATPADSQEAGNKRNFHLEVSNNNKQRHGRKRKKGGRKKKRRKNKKKGGTRTVKLVPPSAPTVSQLTESSVLVLWKIPENDGLPISLFRVQYREVRPSSGQWQTVEDDISPKARRYKVTRLKAGGTYKFRIAAVYSNNDNRNSPNSRRFHLNISPNGVSRPPTLAPRVVEAKPFIYQNIYAIGIKWQYIPVDGSSITGFYIFYKPYGSEEDFHVETLLGAGIRNHLLTDLKPDTEYSVKMQCFNSAGASDFSNMVVKRTLPLAGQAPAEPPTPVLPPSEEQETEAPPSSRRASEGLEQPVILGIVLGGLLLLLAIFLAMCWWKQRQQKRRNQSLENSVKYPGDHRTLYSDSLRTTTTTTPTKPTHPHPHHHHPNGGPYPLNGLNGVALANGHGPPVDQQVGVSCSDSGEERQQQRAMSLSTHSDVYTGKPSYYHGNNGLVVNGTVPGYGHGNNSDNNFNKIRQTHSTDNMMNPSGYLPSSLHSLGPPPPPLCHLPPTSTSPTAHHPPHHHHPSYPPSPTTSPHPHGRRRRQNHSGGGSHSEEQDSAEELEQQQPLMRGEVQGQAGEPPTYFCAPGNNNNNNRGCRGVGDSLDNGHHHHHHHHPPHHPHPHRPGYGYPPASSSNVLYPSSSKDGRGEEGRAEWGGEEGVWHPWSGPSPHVTSGSGQHGGRHKRRRRRGQGGGGDRGEREHSVRDQATNTDLSSNGEEGTTEGITCSQSPAGSLSNGSDNSGHSDPADVTTVTLPDRTSADRLLCAVTVPPVGSL